MHHFEYIDGVLNAEDIPVPDIALDVGTPFYCYSTATFLRHIDVFQHAFDGMDSLICYSVKANSNIAVLATLASRGVGADIVSEGELRRALAAGVPTNHVIFSGVGKTDREMAFALENNILQFNVESEPELAALNDIAVSMDKQAPVALRINPDVDARTHEHISTGREGDKFGLPLADARRIYALAANMPGIEIVGVDVHIGSQIDQLGPFEEAFGHLAQLVMDLREDGHTITNIDLGGGLAIHYHPDDPEPPLPDDYAVIVKRTIAPLGARLIFEPGRLIAGNAGILVARVIYVKETKERTFVVLDSAMNDLIRPSLYGAYHHILPVSEPVAGSGETMVDFVGPVCETTDTFAKSRMFPPIKAGDLVAFMAAGAYSAVMASSYNTRPLTPEVLVNGEQYAIVRKRPEYDEMLAQEHIPNWVK